MRGELDEAVSRAREHLLTAMLEGIEAARALFAAAGIATGRDGSTPDRLPDPPTDCPSDPIRAGLDDLLSALRRGRLPQPPPTLARSLSDAFEHEIRRWEKRSQSDPDARVVLRAFLGLRELSWEIGLIRRTPDARRAATRAKAPKPPAPGPGDPAHPRGAASRRAQRRPRPDRAPDRDPAPPPRMPRVQRFDVEQG